jgi:hypothetical protein
MTPFIRFVLCGSLLSLAPTAQAIADPVSITSGFLTATGPFETAPVSVTGTLGFSTSGITDPGEGHLDAFTDCRPCMPGDPIRLGGFLPAFDGAATLNGNSYELTIDVNNPVSMQWSLTSGTVTAPPFGLTARLLETSFTLTGRFFPDSQSSGIPLLGRGIVSILLSPLPGSNSDPSLWNASLLRYDFQSDTAPIPEPGSLALLGIGLAATWRARRRHL